MVRAIVAAAFLCCFAGAAAASGLGGPDSKWDGSKYVESWEPAAKAAPRYHKRRAARHHKNGRGGRHRAARPVTAAPAIGQRMPPAVVRSRAGATARVNPAHRAKFQCLIDRLDASGYRIRFMGGYRRTYIAGTRYRSKHWVGNALDINQYGRNVTRPRMPAAAGAMARACGLTPGSDWRGSPDTGHFEVPGNFSAAPHNSGAVADMADPVAENREIIAKTGDIVAAGAVQYASLGPLKIVKPAPLRPSDKAAIFERDEDYNYLVAVYNRTPVKKDRSGDFTWKDPSAAALRKMSVPEYVIGGMAPKLRRALAKLGRELDSKGIQWSILSGFRDDYRQRIAAGYKASICRSWHGGSCLTKGWGDGRAVDVTLVSPDPDAPRRAGDIFAKYGRAYGLARPMAVRDPGHIELAGLSSGRRASRHKHRRYAAR